MKPFQVIDAKEQRLTLGAMLNVEQDGKHVTTLNPSRNYYSSTVSDPTIAGFFGGEATSEVGRRTRVGGDLWTAMRPDLSSFDPVIAAVDKRLARTIPDISPEGPTPDQVAAMRAYTDRQGQAIRNLAALYVANPLPVDFRINVNPFVIWIWVGGAIGVAGALIAVWPAPEARRRRVSDVYAARLARDLGRAGSSLILMAILLALVLVALLAVFVLAPLRGGDADADEPEGAESPEVTDLEARKEAIYRQIRDAELDREQGKLTQADWKRVDAELRREAIDILKRIDAATGARG